MDQTGNVRQQMDMVLTAELQQISTPSNAILHSRLTRFSFRFNEALHFHGSFFFSSNKRLSKCKWTTLLPEPTKKIDTAKQISTMNKPFSSLFLQFIVRNNDAG